MARRTTGRHTSSAVSRIRAWAWRRKTWKSWGQKFFRAGDPRVRDVPGHGLGFSIAKNLVEMQGGKIEIVSELNKGSNILVHRAGCGGLRHPVSNKGQI